MICQGSTWPQAEHRDVNSLEMFIMFYDFNSFPAPVKLPSYLLEYGSIQESSSDEVINISSKKILKVFQLLTQQKGTFTLDAENSQLWLTVFEQNAGFLKEISKDSGVKDPLNKIPFMKTKNQNKTKGY